MAQVEFTPDALKDIESIWQYIARDGMVAADRFIGKMYDTLESLAAMPLSARKRPELGEHIRSRPFGNYVIFYEPTDIGILVINVLWGGRDIDAVFNV